METPKKEPSQRQIKKDILETSIAEAREEPVIGLSELTDILDELLDNEEKKLLIKLLKAKVV